MTMIALSHRELILLLRTLRNHLFVLRKISVFQPSSHTPYYTILFGLFQALWLGVLLHHLNLLDFPSHYLVFDLLFGRVAFGEFFDAGDFFFTVTLTCTLEFDNFILPRRVSDFPIANHSFVSSCFRYFIIR
jgi:hypothetical protein